MSEPTQDPAPPPRGGNDANAAAPPAPPPKYPFSVLAVLGTALRVTKRNFIPFFVLACVIDLPVIVMHLSGAARDYLGLVLVLGIVTNALTAAVVTYGVIM